MESTDDQASRDPGFADPAQIGINAGEDAPVRDVREKFPHTNTRELCSYGIGEAQRHAVLSLAIELSPTAQTVRPAAPFGQISENRNETVNTLPSSRPVAASAQKGLCQIGLLCVPRMVWGFSFGRVRAQLHGAP